MCENGKEWAAIQAEYVNSTISLKALAEKYGLPLSTVKRISAQQEWSAKRRKFAESKREKVCQKLHDKDVTQTVKDIERCCIAAGKLIDKIYTAINQLDRTEYITLDDQTTTTKETHIDNTTVTAIVKTRKMKNAHAQTLIDTRRIVDLARALLCLKQLLTDYSGNTLTEADSGIIEIAAAVLIDNNPDIENANKE